ncbi:MAG TPA: dephospho-CoA kinase [Candidatus Latescibacteria bacterium]|nr:dephospho-CoA kinase [Candidatus Latescibacterota bacterium]
MVIGVTGGTGSGKTEVCRFLEKFGAKLISADEVGHRVLEDLEVRERLVEVFGDGVLGKDGRIDRKRLGRKVFGDPEALATLNAIVHPPLLKRLKGEISDALREDPDRPVVVDAALIPEWGIYDWFDVVVSVKAPEPLRIVRLMKKGFSEGEARERVRVQMSEAEREQMASYVIENIGSLEELKGKVALLWRRLRGKYA